MTETTWTLSPEEFVATQKRAEAINARAVKRGFTGRVSVEGTSREITETDEAGLPRTRVVVDAVISGDAPKYNGWTFLAAVDSIDTENGSEFVLRTAPGIDESGVDRTQLGAGRCEHCNTTRRNRRYTYLVRHESGDVRQVGSTCIKDFTGWAGRPVFLSVEELRDELSDFIGGFASQGAEYSPETVIAAAWALSRRFGWVPASVVGGVSTRERVSSYLYGKGRADRELRAEIADEIPAATKMAKTITSAILDDLDGTSDYVSNLKTLLRASSVAHKHLGMVVSAVAAYERMTGEAARRRAEAEERERLRAEVKFAGEVGEKITVTGTVTRLRAIEGHFGYNPKTSMLVIVEGVGIVAKMFTTAAWAWDVEQGDTLTITGTVKEHEEYQGVQQTALVRPKLIDQKRENNA